MRLFAMCVVNGSCRLTLGCTNNASISTLYLCSCGLLNICNGFKPKNVCRMMVGIWDANSSYLLLGCSIQSVRIMQGELERGKGCRFALNYNESNVTLMSAVYSAGLFASV